MSTEVTVSRPEIMAIEARKEDWVLTQRQADAFLKSGLFADTKNLAQAIVKIKLGEAIGLSPIESMASVYVINGRPCIASDVRAARMKRAGYDWRILKLTDDVCEIAVYRSGQEIGRASYTFQEAQKAGLASRDNWKNYRTDMLFARAITRAQRRFAPEVLGLPLASREEAIDADWSEVLTADQQPTGSDRAKAIKEQLAAAKATAGQDEPIDLELLSGEEQEAAS